MDEPKPDEKVCFNCKHMMWLVAIGLGVRCGYQVDYVNGKLPKMIPYLRHTCDNFKMKDEKQS